MNIILKADSSLKKILPQPQLVEGLLYKQSQFVVPFIHNNKHYVYHTLTKQCVESELPKTVHVGEGYDDFIQNMYYVPEEKDECAFYQQISTLMRTLNHKKGYTSYTILPTLKCNARCVYCYESGSEQTSMTRETVDHTIAFITDTRDKNAHVHLTWFGGEPLLRTDIIDHVSRELKDAGIAFKGSVVTNGSLLNDELITKMIHDWHIETVQISMDGAESDYIARKLYYKYQHQYEHVISFINKLTKTGIKIMIRCNVDLDNCDNLPLFVQDLGKGIDDKQNVHLYFAPLHHASESYKDLELWDQIIGMRPMVKEAGFLAMPFLGFRKTFRVFHCMADGYSVVIGPEGGLYPCEHCDPATRFGDVHNGITHPEVRKEFRRVDQVREKCQSCAFLPECTALASCPIKEYHCRDVRYKTIIGTIKYMIDEGHLSHQSDDMVEEC